MEPVQAITTGAAGLAVEEVEIPSSQGPIPGYWAMPAEGKNFPVMLVVQEIFGVNEHIKDVCRRFAHLGYLAIAPELFARYADVSQIADAREIAREVASKVPDREVLLDLDTAVDMAASTGNADVSRLGIIGFCWGGRVAWFYAAHSSRLKAAAAFYGQLEGETNMFRTRKAIDLAAEMKAPVIGFYGAEDASIPVGQVSKMRAALAEAGKDCEIVVYPDAGHAFFADYRPSYREPAAQDAWGRALTWFRKHGAA